MSEEPEGFGVTAQDISAYDWQTVVTAAGGRECRDFYAPLFARAEALGQAGDQRGRQVFSLLAKVATTAPTEAAGEGGRGDLEPFTPADLDALAGILPDVIDSEMRARIADTLWERRRDHRAGRRAVADYIAAAAVLEDELWPPFVDRLERALRLGATFGLHKAYHLQAVAAVETTIARHEATDTGLMCARLMELLLSYPKTGDPAHYSALADRIAQRLAAAGNWFFAREYWGVKAGWDHRKGDGAAAKAAQLEAAQTYVAEAELIANSDKPSFMNAAHLMEQGVEALRRAGADPARITAAHRRLMEYGKGRLGEMETISLDLAEIPGLLENMAQAQAAARACVSGRPLPEAIRLLAFAMVHPIDPAAQRREVTENMDKFVFTHLIGEERISTTGRTTGHKPPVAPWDPAQTEEAINKEMFSQATQIGWPLKVDLFIEPVRQQIESEHALQRRDLAFLVTNSPFVSPGREGIYLRGLLAGFKGDWLVATHLLVPQVENSVRVLLEERLITSGLRQGVQDERDLGWLLTRPEVADVFGPAMAFDLRGVLVERWGYNLRNEMAHGLMDEGAFYAASAVYLWWLALRLCIAPFIGLGDGTA